MLFSHYKNTSSPHAKISCSIFTPHSAEDDACQVKCTNTIPSKNPRRLQSMYRNHLFPRISSVMRMIISEIKPLITWYSQEVINGSDVINSISQHADLLLPLLFEEIHVFLSQLALGFSSQSQCSINDL